MCDVVYLFFCFKQKTAYEMRISDWSSDVCSSDLLHGTPRRGRSPDLRIANRAPGHAFANLNLPRPDPAAKMPAVQGGNQTMRHRCWILLLAAMCALAACRPAPEDAAATAEIGRAQCRERVGQEV